MMSRDKRNYASYVAKLKEELRARQFQTEDRICEEAQEVSL